ncbi:hypothetical protein D3C75_1149190 [compost metagenome]
MADQVAAFETAGLYVHNWLTVFLELAGHLADIIADNIRGAACQHDEQIAVHDVECIGNHFAQLICASEYNLIFRGIRAGDGVSSYIT